MKHTDILGHRYKWVLYLTDVLIHVAVFTFLVYFVVERAGWRNYDTDSRFYYDRFGHLFVLLMCYVASVALVRIRTKDLESGIETYIRAGFQVFFTYVFFAVSVGILYHTFPGHLLMWSSLSAAFIIPLVHLLITKIIVRRRHQDSNVIKTVFVGIDENGKSLCEQFGKGYSTRSYRTLGFFGEGASVNVGGAGEVPVLGGISDVTAFLQSNDVDELYCCLNPAKFRDEVNGIIECCNRSFITFYYVPDMDGYVQRRLHFSRFGDVTLIKLHNEPLADPYKSACKRLFDIVFSGIVLVTIFPVVWLFVAIITKCTSPGPVLFRQKRTGYNGKSFTCLKFRSMKVNADADRVQATSGDPRKTKFGDFLRRSSIDELPQFINVFRGDMSVVGPRPHMEYHTEVYSGIISDYLVRHLCKPGITGWAQVCGCRGETKKVEEMEARVAHDIWYIENWSMLLDLRIILRTVIQIVKKDSQAY